MSSNDNDSSDSEMCWINWFCSLRGNEYYCEVDEEWIRDKFNLAGLADSVPFFRQALDMILDLEDGDDDFDNELNLVQESAETLYNLIHARFILTSQGMAMMLEKYQEGIFGACPRFYCDNQETLPIGLSDTPGEKMVKLYCPKCRDVYEPKARFSFTDGAAFGTGFPHMLFMTYPKLRPKPPTNSFIPRLYGFKIHPQAYELQHEEAERSSRAIQSLIPPKKVSFESLPLYNP